MSSWNVEEGFMEEIIFDSIWDCYKNRVLANISNSWHRKAKDLCISIELFSSLNN
jgi:hypothetical protein